MRVVLRKYGRRPQPSPKKYFLSHAHLYRGAFAKLLEFPFDFYDAADDANLFQLFGGKNRGGVSWVKGLQYQGVLFFDYFFYGT